MDDQKFYFFQSFLNLIDKPRNKDKYSANFVNYIKNKYPKNFELVELLSSLLVSLIIKPQRLLHDTNDYYIAIDMYSHTIYMCYRQILMLDIDFYKDNINKSEEKIITDLETYSIEKNLTFAVYKTRNGIHAFLISKEMDYKNKDSIKIMLDMEVDFNYIIYSYLRGWSVRLNKKMGETNNCLYTFIKNVGSASIDKKLENLVLMHINLCEKFSNENPSKMYAG